MPHYSLRDYFKMKVMGNLPEAHVFAIKLFHFCSDKVPGTSEAKNSQVIKFTYFIYLLYQRGSNFLTTTYRDKLVGTGFIILMENFPCDNVAEKKKLVNLEEQR